MRTFNLLTPEQEALIDLERAEENFRKAGMTVASMEISMVRAKYDFLTEEEMDEIWLQKQTRL